MEKQNMKLKGTYTALITPFLNNGNVDYKALEKLVHLQNDAKVSGIVLLGTTGENSTLDYYEKCKIIDTVSQTIAPDIDLIIAINSNDTSKALNEIKGLSSSKAKAFLVGTPYYNKPTEKGLITHFTKIANESYKPIILYNVPSRTGIKIPLSAIEKLSSHPNIIGIKEASGDLDYITNLMKYKSESFRILSGNDSQTLTMMALGASGCISVASNIVPHEIAMMTNLCRENKYASARLIHDLLLDLMNACFVETNPIPIKYMLSKIGLVKNKLREPLTKLSVKNISKINNILQSYFHFD